MNVLIFRHGHDLKLDGATETSLSREGRAHVARTTEAFFSSHPGVRISRCLTSPALRAVQTAEIVARASGAGAVGVTDSLGSTATSEELDDLFVGLIRNGDPLVALIGHEPTLGNAILRWSGLPENDPDDGRRAPWVIARGSAALVTPHWTDGLGLKISSMTLIGAGTRPLPTPKKSKRSTFA